MNADDLKRRRLAAALLGMRRAELSRDARLNMLAEKAPNGKRLLVLAAFGRAHASRLLARIAAMGFGRGPELVASPEDLEVDKNLKKAFKQEALSMKEEAARYAKLANIARKQSDISSAWVCELNSNELLEQSAEMLQMSRG